MPLRHRLADTAAMAQPSLEPTMPDLPSNDEAPLSADLPSEETNRTRILVVEDNQDVAYYIGSVLRDHYEVSYATDGRQGLEIARQQMPDLIVTDIMMPDVDGLELCRQIRADELTNHIPIVIITARATEDDRLTGIGAGADAYLYKPFRSDELLLRVEKLLEQRRRLRKMFTNSRSDDETSRQIPEADVNFFNDINKLIDDNLISGEVSTSFLADKLSTSVSTLNRRLKNMSGLTATTYIRNRRMLMAKRLLETTDKAVSEIEVQCGFNTSGHFSRVFKAETGLSPVDYRQKCKSKK